MRPVLNSNYPLGAALIEVVKRSGLSLPSFLSAIGYSNINKALRSFQTTLSTGKAPPILLERLAQSPFALSSSQLSDAINSTDIILAQEQRSAHEQSQAQAKLQFRPYLKALTTSQRPSSITIFALINGQEILRIELPQSFTSWDSSLQHRYAQRKIRSHYQQSNGEAPLLGAITGYHLFKTFGAPPLLFTIDGQPLGLDQHAKTSTVILKLRGSKREIPQALWRPKLRRKNI
ncbi:MAG: hypothetical protein ACK5Y6_05540 [Pseudomonadota bacterium]